MMSRDKLAEMMRAGTQIEDVAAGFKLQARIKEKDFRAMYADRSLSLNEIGRRLGISASAVCCRAQTRGLPPRGNGKRHQQITETQRELFALLYGLNVPPGDIVWFVTGKERGANGANQFVSKYRKRLGLPARGRGWRTTIRRQAILRDAKVQDLMRQVHLRPPSPGETHGQP